MKRRSILRRGALPMALLLGFGGAGASIWGVSCQQSPVTVPVRSLDSSGRVSFVCLSAPSVDGDQSGVELPLFKCTGDIVDYANEYTFEDDAGNFVFQNDAGEIDAGAPIPHLYALVTQTKRGEVAVVDTSVRNNPVLDEDPRIPGANFLQVGADPVSIASSPGGVATFVAVAETGRPGLFGLPSYMIRPASVNPLPDAAGYDGGGVGGGVNYDPALSNQPIPRLTSWPACVLPSAPGDMVMVNDLPDPADPTQTRKTCDSAYEKTELCTGGDHKLECENQGRQKLVVAMPDYGGIAIIDAASLLERPAGSFSACEVERWLPLQADLTGLGQPPPPVTGPACSNPKPTFPALASSYKPRPAGMTYADGVLYVGDYSAPIIHVVDLHDPCAPSERAPLLPTSALNPERAVNVGVLTVSPAPTPDFKRYLYAADIDDSSLMVFDVSDTSTSRRPLVRQHPEWNPFQPSDRIRLGGTPKDIAIVQRDVPATDPATGVAAEGVLCDPDPQALICTSVAPYCDVGTQYRTSDAFDTGAGPNKLRGTFAFVALSNGHVSVVDIADFDAPCRVPTNSAVLFGCPADAPGSAETLTSTNDMSCNIVMPHAQRSANYDVANEFAGFLVPGIQAYPLLFKLDGTQVDYSDATSPHMVATIPAHIPDPGPTKIESPGLHPFGLNVAGNYNQIDPATGIITDSGQPNHTLAVNYEDPRAQAALQNWTVTFEGAIPGFDQRLGGITLDEPKSADVFSDGDGLYCTLGVHSLAAVTEILTASGDANAASNAVPKADYVQIINDLPDESDAFWTIQQNACPLANRPTYATCLTEFATPDLPTQNRDLIINEAYQDHLEVAFRDPSWPTCARDADCPISHNCDKTKNLCLSPTGKTEGIQKSLAEVLCCFPTALQYSVRGGDQWIIAGDQSGFLHHVIADATTGVCRDSCDPTLARLNGRAASVPNGDDTIHDGDAKGRAFINPLFRFAVREGVTISKGKTFSVTPDRDMQFRFGNTNPFSPLSISLATDSTTQILPMSIRYLDPTGELAVVDGSVNGVVMIDLATVSVSRSFF